jgi:hypothetical protein
MKQFVLSQIWVIVPVILGAILSNKALYKIGYNTVGRLIEFLHRAVTTVAETVTVKAQDKPWKVVVAWVWNSVPAIWEGIMDRVLGKPSKY